MPKLEGFANGDVDKENDYVTYNDARHEYVGKKDHAKYTSVTTLIHNYTQPFDEDFWASYKACEFILGPEGFAAVKGELLRTKRWNNSYIPEEDIEAFKKKKAEIIQEYADKRNAACERGTEIHAIQENMFYAKDPKMKKYVGGGKFDVKKGYYKLDVDKAVFPEFLISYDFDEYLKIAGQIDFLVKDGNDIIIGDWKGLALDTPIATETGWKMMGELTLNDRIFDRDGKLTRIRHISEIHHNPCYKITFDNNDTLIADHEHKWIISKRPSKKFPWKDTVMTTEEIAERLKNGEKGLKIVNAKPLDLPKAELPIDPYVLGVWLGDGSSADGKVTSARPEIYEEIARRGYQVGQDLLRGTRGEKLEYRTIWGLGHILKELGLLKNKHIPDMYMRASYEQRLDLLRGLMDTDGFYHKKRNRFVMGVGKEWQAQQTAELVASLGGKPTIFKVKKHCNGKIFDCFDCCWSTNDYNPFLIRNKEIKEIKVDCNSFRKIKSVEKVDTVPTRCLEVESETHSYLAGKMLIPTHNTNGEIKTSSYFDRATKKKQMMKFPLNDVEDCNFYHYSLQLSLYAYLLQKINPKFNIVKLMIVHFDHQGNEVEYECKYMKEEVARMLLHFRKEQKIKAQLELDKPIIF